VADVTPQGAAVLRSARKRPLDLARSGPYFAALLIVTQIAFWPTYLSLAFSASSAFTHFHAVTATVWLLLLIAQPLAIRTRRLAWHRALGQASYVVAAVVFVSIVLLAHDRMRRATAATADLFAVQTYVLYLQLSLAALFGLSYGLGLATRRNMALHARFMVCTGLTLIDPVVIRLMFWADPTPTWNYQWFTFGLTDLAFIVLIYLERDSRIGRRVFPAMLSVFAASQLPALLGFTDGPSWQSFARWFATLPLT